MPELPEVETIANQLDNKIAGKVIENFEVLEKKSFDGKIGDVIGTKVNSVKRRAKVAIVELSNGKFLLIHLKMTGQLIYIDHNLRVSGGHSSHEWHTKLPSSHTRLIFTFGGGAKLYFNDMRKFGWCREMTRDEMNKYFLEFGPDAFPEIDVNYLRERAAKMPNSSVKKFILDQSIIAGVGNIYADESLFDARIHPETLVSKLNEKEWQTLTASIIKILKLGIEKGGTTDSDYVNANGEKGGMQDYLKVYHKEGQACPDGCGGKIERIVVAGRGTHYCPNCQKVKK